MHHLRPAWALGQDNPDNFWPSLSRHQIVRNKAELKNDSTKGRRYNVISIHDWWNVKLQEAFENFFKNGNEEYRKYLMQKYLPLKDESSNNKKKKSAKKMKPGSGKGNNNSAAKEPKTFQDQKAVETYGENRISVVRKYLFTLKPPIKLVVKMKCKKACEKKRYN